MSAELCDDIQTRNGRHDGTPTRVPGEEVAAPPLAGPIGRHPDLDPAARGEVTFGFADPAAEDNRNAAPSAARLAGLPGSVGNIAIYRLSASGLDAVALACVNLTIAGVTVILRGDAFAAQIHAARGDPGVPDDARRAKPDGGVIAIGRAPAVADARPARADTRRLQAVGGRCSHVALGGGLRRGATMILERS